MRFFAAALTLASAFGQSAQSLNPDWPKPFPPFCMIGSVYWVETHDSSSYLITTTSGHIPVNSGLVDSIPQIRSGIERLDFRLSGIKILTATHGRFDPVAGSPGEVHDPDRFVNPQGFNRAVDRLEKAFRNQLAKEQSKYR